MQYISPLNAIAQGIGILIIIGALIPMGSKTADKEYIFGPLRLLVRRPGLFAIGLSILGIGLLLGAIEAILSIA